ncbi:MAG: OsmC family protein [Candidatus Polarisedimenticolia bacterium]
MAGRVSHVFRCLTRWSAQPGEKTTDYAAYSRRHEVTAGTKPPLIMSAAQEYRGDPALHNPEELLVMALSSCQMLTYLALAGRAGIDVLDYTDEADGRLEAAPGPDGRRAMRMTRVTLRPRIRVAAGSDVERALTLVEEAHAGCFIANSVSCEVTSEPEVIVV